MLISDNPDNYEKQQLYMAGLQNMHPRQILNDLLSFVYGGESFEYLNLKVSAIRAVFPIISSNTDKVGLYNL